MKIKVKVRIRTLILLALGFIFIYLLVIPFGSLEIAKILDRKGSDKAKIFYESYLSKSYLWNDSRALYEYGSGLIGREEKFNIFMRGWGGGDYRQKEDLIKGVQALEKILKGRKKSKKDLKYKIYAYEKLLNGYIGLQEGKELLNWIEWGQKEDSKDIKYVSDLYLSLYYFVNRDYDLAEEVISRYNGTEEIIDYRYYFVKAELALWRGDIEEAKELYSWETSKIDIFRNNQAQLFGSSSFEYRDYWLEEIYSKRKGDIKLKGKVEFNGRPMPFVEIYAQKAYDGIRVSGGDLVAITDINGEYETLGLASGSYDLGLGLSPSSLNDKVYQKTDKFNVYLDNNMTYDFSFTSPFKLRSQIRDTIIKNNKLLIEWEEVQGADYYRIEITGPSQPLKKDSGYITFAVRDENNINKIRDSKASLDLEKLNGFVRGISRDGDDGLVEADAILGSFIPGINYYYTVNAYDKSDRLVSSTMALRTRYGDMGSFMVGGSLDEGEKLILKKKYQEAIDYYKNLLKDDPHNSKALLYLTKIYMVGYKSGLEDYNEALDYARTYDKLAGDNYLKSQVIDFMDHKARRENKDIIEEILKSKYEEGQNDEIYYTYANYYISIRQYDLAKEYIEKLQDYDYMNTRLFYINLYRRDLGSALDLIKEEKLELYRADKNKLLQAIEAIDHKLLAGEDYKILKEVIENILSEDLREDERDSIYKKSIAKIDSPIIKNLIKEISFEEFWIH